MTDLFLDVDRYRLLAEHDLDARAAMVRWITGLAPWAAERQLLVLQGSMYFKAVVRRDGHWLGVVSPLQSNGAMTTTVVGGQRELVHALAPLPTPPPPEVARLAEPLLPGSSFDVAPVLSFRRPAGPGALMAWEVAATE